MKFEEFVEKIFVPNVLREHPANIFVYGQEIRSGIIVVCKRKTEKRILKIVYTDKIIRNYYNSYLESIQK